MLVGAVIPAHSPLLKIRVFAKLQMMCTRSGKLYSCFELQILLLCSRWPLPLPSFFVSICEYSGLQVSQPSFSVWWCMVVVCAQSIPAHPKACILLETTTHFHRHLHNVHLVAMSLICKMRNKMPVTRRYT